MPSVNITSVDPSEIISAKNYKTIVFTASETMSEFECSYNNVDFSTCQSPLQLTNLIDGYYQLAIRAKDQAGNIGATASVSWTIDTKAPTITITSISPSASITSQASMNLNFVADESSVSFECNLDSFGFASCQSPYTIDSLAEGTHLISIRAKDLAANYSTVVSYQWTIDQTAPTIKFDSIEPNQSVTSTTKLTVNFSSNETAQFFCRLDSEDFTSCSSPSTLSQISDGLHSTEIKAYDLAGNISNVLHYDFTVDTIAPETTITSVQPQGAYISTNTITFAFSSNESSVSYECHLDSGTWTACASLISYSSLSEGQHSFYVRAIDSAGNVDQTPAQYTWTVETTALQTTNVAASTTLTTSITMTWNTTLPATSQVEYVNLTTNADLKTSVDSTLTTSHTLTVTGLTANTLYRIYVISTTPSGKTDVSPELLVRTKR